MRRGEIIRAMDAAGLHVERSGRDLLGVGDRGTVYARFTGSAWKLRTSRTANRGVLVATEEQAAAHFAALFGGGALPQPAGAR